MIVVRYALSLIFIAQMYLALSIVSIVYAPWAFFSSDGAFAAAHFYSRWVRVSARVLCGLRSEVRGIPPTGEVIIAAKHQSFFDILMIFSAVPRGKFIMKRELLKVPFLSQYARRMGCVAVDRGKRGVAIAKMKADVANNIGKPGQLIIYPQGTRVPPGDKRSYKVGTGLIYEQLEQPCVPVGTNIGHFWPKRSLLRKPGLAVVEFLPPIPAGLPVAEFMQRLEADVEASSDALSAEAVANGA